jgi:hypothetical protein
MLEITTAHFYVKEKFKSGQHRFNVVRPARVERANVPIRAAACPAREKASRTHSPQVTPARVLKLRCAEKDFHAWAGALRDRNVGELGGAASRREIYNLGLAEDSLGSSVVTAGNRSSLFELSSKSEASEKSGKSWKSGKNLISSSASSLFSPRADHSDCDSESALHALARLLAPARRIFHAPPDLGVRRCG